MNDRVNCTSFSFFLSNSSILCDQAMPDKTILPEQDQRPSLLSCFKTGSSTLKVQNNPQHIESTRWGWRDSSKESLNLAWDSLGIWNLVWGELLHNGFCCTDPSSSTDTWKAASGRMLRGHPSSSRGKWPVSPYRKTLPRSSIVP